MKAIYLKTEYLIKSLGTEAGYLDTVYKIFENKEAPSRLAGVNAGATTVREDREGKVSHNHYSPGAVYEWLFSMVAGITVVGENRFSIKPVPGGTLTHAGAEYKSLYGIISSRWEKTKNGFRLKVNIPSNTTAKIELPNWESYDVEAGAQNFDFAYKEQKL